MNTWSCNGAGYETKESQKRGWKIMFLVVAVIDDLQTKVIAEGCWVHWSIVFGLIIEMLKDGLWEHP